MQPPLDSWHSSVQKLREQAEAILQQWAVDPPLQSVWTWQQRLRELQLYQAEVEMQHEELRESQMALQAALDKYTELYDFAPIGYLTLDYSGTILEANLTAAALLGIERRDLIGRLLCHSLSTRADKDTFYLHCNRVLATGGRESCDVTLRRPDGTMRVARLDSRAFNTEQHQLHTALSDVTARRQIEADLRAARDGEADLRAVRDELEQRVLERAEALQRINERLEQEIAERKLLEAQMVQVQKMQAIGTLAGGIAHEFNNVLAVMLGYTTLLQKQVQQNPTALAYVQEVKRAGERAKDFVQQILMFSRQDPVTHRPAPLSRVVNETLGFLSKSLPTTIDLHVHMEPEVESVLVMHTPLFQVLINLCSNAEYAMRETGGRLDIEAAGTAVDAAFSGHHHDYRMLKQAFPPELDGFEDIHVRVDLGYQGIQSDYKGDQIEIPTKKPRKSKKNPAPPLSDEQKAANKALSQVRIFIEHAIGGMKRYNILVHVFRNRKADFEDDAIGICAGLWNLTLGY